MTQSLEEVGPKKNIKLQNLLIEKCALASVYFALLLDNLLLTAVVPILPHYVHHDEESSSNRTITVAQNSLSNRYHSSGIEPITRPIDEDGQQFYPFVLQSSTVHFHIGRGYHPDAGDNSRLGFLLSLKAIVQLAANPLIAIFCRRRGFHSALLFGSLNIIGCTLLFAFGKSYEILAAARALQGITSACFTIAGLGLVASIFREESSRSVALGRVLGGGAVGVLLGYPLGGFLYQLSGKTVPFLLIFSLALVLLGAFLVTSHFFRVRNDSGGASITEASGGPLPLESPSTSIAPRIGNETEAKLKDEYDPNRIRSLLAVAVGAIFLSTSVMALLEPCLPLWLMETMKPQRWQLGAVFLPDSCGYLLTTHILGGLAYRFGRWKVSLLSMLLLAVSCLMVPLATSVAHLTLPHFGIGFGIGAVDASLVPLLATLADQQHSKAGDNDGRHPSYGGTFALGQTAVSLAYCLGPLLGGILVESVGFPVIMLVMGILNLFYAPLILLLRPVQPTSDAPAKSMTERTGLAMFFLRRGRGYTLFHNETGEQN